MSKRISDELNINYDQPYIEIKEIKNNSIFLAKKSKTFEEEKNVANKAPVDTISINDLNSSKKEKVKDTKVSKFSYVIKSGTNVNDWQFPYNRLVHPAGFKYFAEIVLFLIAQNVQTLADSQTPNAPGSMRQGVNSSGFNVFTTPFVQRKRLEARTIPTFSFETVNNQVSNDTTIIMIAHRISTLEGCDRIIDIASEQRVD